MKKSAKYFCVRRKAIAEFKSKSLIIVNGIHINTEMSNLWMYVPLWLISSKNSAHHGKDIRYAMEQNVGPTTAGDQESGRL